MADFLGNDDETLRVCYEITMKLVSFIRDPDNQNGISFNKKEETLISSRKPVIWAICKDQSLSQISSAVSSLQKSEIELSALFTEGKRVIEATSRIAAILEDFECEYLVFIAFLFLELWTPRIQEETQNQMKEWLEEYSRAVDMDSSSIVENEMRSSDQIEARIRKQVLPFAEFFSAIQRAESFVEMGHAIISQEISTELEELKDTEKDCFEIVNSKIQSIYLPFMQFISDKTSPAELEKSLNATTSRIFEEKGCENILDLVIDMPETTRVIVQLKKVLEMTGGASKLAEALNKQVKARLLTLGVLTETILNQYVNILNTMLLLEPGGSILTLVTQPIKQYLLSRNDTVRCIISLLTQASSNSYVQWKNERVRVPALCLNIQEDFSSDEDEGVPGSGEGSWGLIEKVEGKSSQRLKYKETDMFNVLVNLYESPDAFLEEYENMLAEKFLLSGGGFDLVEETKNVELLKQRFVDGNIHRCDIILRDIRESIRVSKNIKDKLMLAKKQKNQSKMMIESGKNKPMLSPLQIEGYFLSKGYWPINHEIETFELPEEITEAFKEYEEAYFSFKGMRRLNWHNNLAVVTISLDFKSGPCEFKCQPAHAVIISCFDEDKLAGREGWTQEQLASQLKCSPQYINQKISFWVQKGVIFEEQQGGMAKSGSRSMSLAFLSHGDSRGFADAGKVLYSINEDYSPELVQNGNEANFDVHQENEMFLRGESTKKPDLLQINDKIEGVIVTIVQTLGPKTFEKLLRLLNTVYKPEINIAIKDGQLKDILKYMVSRCKIFFDNHSYYA